MKNCPYCNAPLNDTAVFCGACGKPLDATNESPVNEDEAGTPEFETVSAEPQPEFEEPSQTPEAPQPEYQAPQPVNAPVYSVSDFGNTPVDRIKRLCGSTLVLVIAVLISLSVTLNLVNSFVKYSSNEYPVFDSADDILDALHAPRDAKKDFHNYTSEYSFILLSSDLLMLVLPTLTAVGFWLVYSAGKQKTAGMKTSGLTTLKAISIFRIIGCCIAGIASFFIVAAVHLLFISEYRKATASTELNNALAGLTGISTDSFEALADGINTVFTILYIVLAIVFVLLIIIFAKLISAINKVKRSIRDNAPSKKLSGFAAAMLIIAGAFSIFSFGSGQHALSIILSLINGAYLVCIGALMFKYNSSVATQ